MVQWEIPKVCYQPLMSNMHWGYAGHIYWSMSCSMVLSETKARNWEAFDIGEKSLNCDLIHFVAVCKITHWLSTCLFPICKKAELCCSLCYVQRFIILQCLIITKSNLFCSMWQWVLYRFCPQCINATRYVMAPWGIFSINECGNVDMWIHTFTNTTTRNQNISTSCVMQPTSVWWASALTSHYSWHVRVFLKVI